MTTPTPRPGTCTHDGRFFDVDTLTCVKCDLATAQLEAERRAREDKE